MTDASLRLTYQIEVDLRKLWTLRMQAALAFTNAAQVVADSVSSRKMSPRQLRGLWTQLHARQAEYDCACRAVEALERHDPKSHLLDEVNEYMADAERERRSMRRSKEDDQTEPVVMLKAILIEMRALRDKVNPPVASGSDSTNARREMNSL